MATDLEFTEAAFAESVRRLFGIDHACPEAQSHVCDSSCERLALIVKIEERRNAYKCVLGGQLHVCGGSRGTCDRRVWTSDYQQACFYSGTVVGGAVSESHPYKLSERPSGEVGCADPHGGGFMDDDYGGYNDDDDDDGRYVEDYFGDDDHDEGDISDSERDGSRAFPAEVAAVPGDMETVDGAVLGGGGGGGGLAGELPEPAVPPPHPTPAANRSLWHDSEAFMVEVYRSEKVNKERAARDAEARTMMNIEDRYGICMSKRQVDVYMSMIEDYMGERREEDEQAEEEEINERITEAQKRLDAPAPAQAAPREIDATCAERKNERDRYLLMMGSSAEMSTPVKRKVSAGAQAVEARSVCVVRGSSASVTKRSRSGGGGGGAPSSSPAQRQALNYASVSREILEIMRDLLGRHYIHNVALTVAPPAPPASTGLPLTETEERTNVQADIYHVCGATVALVHSLSPSPSAVNARFISTALLYKMQEGFRIRGLCALVPSVEYLRRPGVVHAPSSLQGVVSQDPTRQYGKNYITSGTKSLMQMFNAVKATAHTEETRAAVLRYFDHLLRRCVTPEVLQYAGDERGAFLAGSAGGGGAPPPS